MLNKSLIVFALTFVLASCSSTSEMPFVRTSGTKLVTEDGSLFEIRGTNLGNWLNPEGYLFQFPKSANSGHSINDGLSQLVGPVYMDSFWKRFVDNYVTERDIEFLAAAGVNTLRLPFHYKLFTSDRYMGTTDENLGFEVIDRTVAWCRKYGLRLILDMHDCPGGQTGDNIDDSYGYPWLFREPEAQNLFIEIWCGIAKRYASEPVIIGYDLMNEPIAHYFEDKEELNAALQPLMIRTVKAIRKYDTRHIVILAGAQWNTNFKVYDDFTFDDNLMYSCHIYKCPPVKGSVKGFVNFMEKSGRPMYMGETGENTDDWVRDFRTVLDECGIGWTFWTYKRLDATRTFVNIPKPEGWDAICGFLESDRSDYASVREHRPDKDMCRRALEEYLESIKFNNCSVNASYVEALGFNAENYE
ncbi:MAG: cellulase family glycosylhydrolase [Bacteroidales bacterium]|nr:cellulase family glycosylhydrolase [Bacteroidales bacterium]